MPAVTWSIKAIGKSNDVSADIDAATPCPQEVKSVVKEILKLYPVDAQVFVDTGGRLDKEFATFNLRIEINKQKDKR